MVNRQGKGILVNKLKTFQFWKGENLGCSHGEKDCTFTGKLVSRRSNSSANILQRRETHRGGFRTESSGEERERTTRRAGDRWSGIRIGGRCFGEAIRRRYGWDRWALGVFQRKRFLQFAPHTSHDAYLSIYICIWMNENWGLEKILIGNCI